MADLPIIEFIRERLAESDASLETRKGSGFYDLFVKPQELMLNPLLSAMETTLIGQSVRQILALEAPDEFDEDLVDDTASNVYVARDEGGFARTVVRVFYTEPLDREFPAFSAEFTAGSLSFFNEEDFAITKSQMALQQEGTLFFMDVAVRSQEEGDAYNVEAGGVTAFVNDADAVNVTNLSKAIGGLPRETNTQLLTRAKNSIGVRDLETVKGINAILREKFPSLREIQAIGMGDPEMMRDILYNVHVGGKTDVYLKTPELQIKTKDVVGLVFDSTRELPRNIHMELNALDFTDPESELGTPLIVSTSVSVKDDVIETAASVLSAAIPSPAGINLSGAEWIKIKVNSGEFVNIKISGANPANTQRFEIINAINAGLGLTVASASGTNKVFLQSQKIGSGSRIVFSPPDFPRTDATLIVFPDAASVGYVPSTPGPAADGTFEGVVATEYLENVDYQVDYENGKIKQLPGSAILSGQIVAETPASGAGFVTTGSNTMSTPVPGAFTSVRVGDEITFTVSPAGAVPLNEVFIVSEVMSDQIIKILGLSPTATDVALEYFIVSNHTVSVSYRHNPLSVDIGNKVLLSDGLSRAVRPGRENFTITDVAFIDVVSIEEIDPDTQESLGVLLNRSGGFGFGGFGEGGFGTSGGGDYKMLVLDPNHRFSAFEDSVLVFDAALFGKSYRITYYATPEIDTIHTVCRDDLERVTGADVLPKNFVPGFVDMTIGIRRDPTNLLTPDNDGLAVLVGNLIHNTPAGTGLQASDIVQLLENEGVDSVQTPFTMQVTVLNTDGSTSIFENQDILSVPPVVLPKETPNFVTPRIVHFYPRNVVVTEVS